METAWATLQEAFTDQISGKNLSIFAMSIRGVFIFVVWLVIVRVADRRVLGRYSAFDVVLSVMIGAVLGRPINGGAPLWGTLAAVAALVAVHWMLAFASHRWRGFVRLIKGDPHTLVLEGRLCRDQMRKDLLTENDLKEMLRLRARLAEPSEARLVILERNGQISAIPLARKLQVVDVAVESDVQTVRLEFAGGA